MQKKLFSYRPGQILHDNNNHPMMIVNARHSIVEVNQAAAFALETSTEAILGSYAPDFFNLNISRWTEALNSLNAQVERSIPHPLNFDLQIIPLTNRMGKIKRYAILLFPLDQTEVEKQKKRQSIDISRSQSFIYALNSVATKISQTKNPDVILQTLGEELKTLGMGNLILRLEDNKTLATVEYISTPQSVLKTIQKFTGVNLQGFSVKEKYWKKLADDYFYQGKALFVSDPIEFTALVIPSITTPLLKKALMSTLGHTKDKAVYLPLIEENQAYGILGIWGSNLTEEDIPILQVFAGQISNILKSAETIKRKQEETDQARRANEFLALLNQVALKLANLTEAEDILKALADELAKHGIFFMLAELEEESSTLIMQYLSMTESNRKIIDDLIMGKSVHKKHVPFWEEIFVQKKSMIIDDSFQMAADAIASVSNIPVKGIEIGLQVLFKQAGWKRISVWHPLITRGRVTGVINFWGKQLHIDDSPTLAIFANQIANALENARLYTAEKQRAESLSLALVESQRRAITDPLTNLYNRYYLYTLGDHEINRAKRYQKHLSLLMIDVDYFKKINDTHGHLVGDQVLIEIARHFQSITRKVDIIARYGGEEFIILLPDTTAKDAFEFAERLRKRMDQGSFIVDKKSHPLPTISIGIASLNHKTLTLEALLNSADKALYRAKEAGRNTIVVQKSEDQKVLNITAS